MELIYIVLSIVILLKVSYYAFWFDYKLRSKDTKLIPTIGEIFMSLPNFILLVLIFYKLYK